MGRTPITQAQWRTVAQWNPAAGERWQRELDPAPSFFQQGLSRAPDPEDVLGDRAGPKGSLALEVSLSGRFAWLEGETSTDQRPVERVNWFDVMEFCRRLNSRLGPAAGRYYTLPSEAQWEYACRAGTKTPFCFGDTISPELANYDGNYAYAEGPKGIYREQATPVGMFPANAWGLQDMHGNVHEWCLDEWHGNYEGAPADGGAWVDSKQGEKSNETEKTRLLRGGSWSGFPGYCRSALRSLSLPVDADLSVGFRVVCLPQGPSLNPQSLNPSTLAVA